MSITVQKPWFTEHRGWEDYCAAAFGLLVVLSPAISGVVEPIVIMNAGLFGVLIAMLALLEVMVVQRWEEILETLCGLWIVASPFVLGYEGELRIAHVVLGTIVAALAVLELWQDRKRRF